MSEQAAEVGSFKDFEGTTDEYTQALIAHRARLADLAGVTPEKLHMISTPEATQRAS